MQIDKVTILKALALAIAALFIYRLIINDMDPDEAFCLKNGPKATYYLTDANGNDVPMSCEDLLAKDGDLTQHDED